MQLPDSLAGRLLGWYAAGHRALPWHFRQALQNK